MKRVRIKKVPAPTLGFQFLRAGRPFVVVEKLEREGPGWVDRWVCQVPNVRDPGSRLSLTALEIFTANLGHLIEQGGIAWDPSSADHRVCSRCGAAGWPDAPGPLGLTCSRTQPRIGATSPAPETARDVLAAVWEHWQGGDVPPELERRIRAVLG